VFVERLGTIVRLQVQRSSLKVGERRARRYDPTPIVSVDAMEVSPHGVVGLSTSDSRVMDIHHVDHPDSKNWVGDEISFGFTGHYHRMRDLFGPHLVDGIAGENILIAVDRVVVLDAVVGGLVIQSHGGTHVHLGEVNVAEPCAEFTGFALGTPEDNRTVARALPRLRDGMRGYYARPRPPEATIRVGDEVFLSR
jgi:hypothetical protein